MPGISHVCHKVARLGIIAAATLTFLVCAPPSRIAQAGNPDQVDVAVDLFVFAGQFAGLPLTKEQVSFARAFVRCMANDNSAADCGREAVVAALLKDAPQAAQNLLNCVTAGKSVMGCGTDAALSQVPEQARPMARCLLEGGNAVDCGKKLAVDTVMERVPDKARPITECIVGGGDVEKCAREEALRHIPNADAKRVAACVLDGTPVAQCGSQAVIGALPKDVQAVANCMAQRGDAVACAKQLAIDQLPSGKTRDFANCLNTPGRSQEQCAAQFGIGVLDPAARQAAQNALDAAQKVQAEADAAMAKLPNLVKNIIKVAQGIREERWDLIIEGGGTEVIKFASNIIIEVILTPAIAPIAAPVIDAMIQVKADAVFGLLRAINDGDAIRVATLIFEYYARMAIDIPCSLVPEGGFKEAVCGNLSLAIIKAVELGTATLKDILGIGEDIAKFIGVYGIGEEVVDIIGEGWRKVKDLVSGIFDGGGDDAPKVRCIGMSPQQFYAQNYLACLSTRMDSPGPVRASCVSTMQTCGIRNSDQLCDSMQKTFDTFKNGIRDTYPAGADNYTAQAFGAFAHSKGEQVCEDGYWDGPAEIEFASRCAATIEAQAHVADNNCPTGNPNRSYSRAAYGVCVAALKRFDKVKATWDMCAGARQRKEDFDRRFRPCFEDELRVSYQPGNPYADVKRPYNLDRCLFSTIIGRRDIWPPDARTNLTGLLDRGPFAPFNPAFVIVASQGRQTAGVNDFLPARFTVGGCKPGVPRMTPATAPERPGTFRIKWEISIPKEELGNCDFGGSSILAARTPAREILRPSSRLRPQVPSKLPSGGSGGAYLVHQPSGVAPKPGGSAIERLSGSSAINSVGGSNLGFDGGGRPQPCPACNTVSGSRPSSAVGAGAPSGGGGTNKVVNNPKPASRSGPDRNVDYGGMSQPKFQEPR